jgi:hypothetical protein
MNVCCIIWILFLHWVFDFILQSDKMAINKSKSWYWLLTHTIGYSFVAFPIAIPLGIPIVSAALFYWYLLITHTLIDGVTSRITSYLWKKEERHWFFVIVGFDQLLHYITIFWFINKF